MQGAACEPLHVETGTAPEPKELIRALRKRLRLTQEQVAERSGGRIGRLDVVKLENGQNQGSSDRARAGMAEAFGVPQADLAAYLDGEIELDELFRRRDQASEELRIPRALLHAFITRGGRARSRQPFDEATLVRVATVHREEPAGGWAKALEDAQEELRREKISDASRAAHARKKAPISTANPTVTKARPKKAANH